MAVPSVLIEQEEGNDSFSESTLNKEQEENNK